MSTDACIELDKETKWSLFRIERQVILEEEYSDEGRFDEDHECLIEALERMHPEIKVLSGFYIGKRSSLQVILPDGQVHRGIFRPNGWIQRIRRLLKEQDAFGCVFCGRSMRWDPEEEQVYGCECGAVGYEAYSDLEESPDFGYASANQALSLLEALDTCVVEGPLSTLWYRRPADYGAERPGGGVIEGPSSEVREVDFPLWVDPKGTLQSAQVERLLSARTEAAFRETVRADRCRREACLLPTCRHCEHGVSLPATLGWSKPEPYCAYPLCREDLEALRRPARYRAPGDPDDGWNGLVDFLVRRVVAGRLRKIEEVPGLGARLQGVVQGRVSPVCERFSLASHDVDGRPLKGVRHPHLSMRGICGVADADRERQRRHRSVEDPDALDAFVAGLRQVAREDPALDPETVLWRSYSKRSPKAAQARLVELLCRALPVALQARGNGASWAEAFGFFDATEGFLVWADKQLKQALRHRETPGCP